MRIRVPIAVAMAAVPALGAAGCLSESGTDAGGDLPVTPTEAVAEAATATFSEPTVRVAIAALGEPARWSGTALIELGAGRFRLEAESERPHRVGAEFARDGVTVVGITGEGFEGTVLETIDGLPGQGDEEQRCWFNPHAPVGFYADPISVEEAMRLTGSIIESLRSEISTAHPAEGDLFEVELERSAQEPRDDFHDGERRVWGDRSLIADLTGPIEVAVDGDRIERLSYELVHRPERNWLLRDRSPRRVRIEATLEPSDEELVLDPPSCQGLE